MPEPGAFLDVARRIGERLCEVAIRDGEGCSWQGLKPAATDGGFAHRRQPLGPDLYCGSAGNAVFLARLHAFTGDERIRATALGAARHAIANAATIPSAIRMSLYAGWAGIGLAAVLAGESLADRACARDGRRLLRRVAALRTATDTTDQFLGSAGAIPALLALHALSGEPWARAAAQRIGGELMEASRVRADGTRSWPPSGPMSDLHRDDLTGFAHGVSGIAWALLELGVAIESEPLVRAALEGFDYERRWYARDVENWLDLRYMAGPDGDVNDGTICQIQWCHGAAGIGLARVRAFELLGHEVHRDEAQAALRTIARDLGAWPQNWQPGFSLCHGVAGNCDPLLEGARVLADETWMSAARRGADLGIERYASSGVPWPGALGPEEIPALMTGVAGTGYFYLRMHAASEVPSLLLPYALHRGMS